MSKSCFHHKSNHVCTYEPDIWQCDRVNVTYDGAMTDAVVERYWNREREREINEYSGHIPQGRCSCPYETDVEPVEVECHRRGMFQKNPVYRCLYLSCAGVSCLSHWAQSSGHVSHQGMMGKTDPYYWEADSRHRHLHWYGQDIMLTGKNDIQHLISTGKENTYGKCRAIFHPNLFKGIWRGGKLFILYKR